MENKMESSIFVSVPIKGVFWHNKEKRPCLMAGTVYWKTYVAEQFFIIYQVPHIVNMYVLM